MRNLVCNHNLRAVQVRPEVGMVVLAETCPGAQWVRITQVNLTSFCYEPLDFNLRGSGQTQSYFNPQFYRVLSDSEITQIRLGVISTTDLTDDAGDRPYQAVPNCYYQTA